MKNRENKLIETLLLIKLINEVLTNPSSAEENPVTSLSPLDSLFNLSPIPEGEVNYDIKRNQINFTNNKLNLLLETVGYGQYKACVPEASYDLTDNNDGSFDFGVSLDELTGVPIGKVIITIGDKGIAYKGSVNDELNIRTTSPFDNKDLSKEAKSFIHELVLLKSQFKSKREEKDMTVKTLKFKFNPKYILGLNLMLGYSLPSLSIVSLITDIDTVYDDNGICIGYKFGIVNRDITVTFTVSTHDVKVSRLNGTRITEFNKPTRLTINSSPVDFTVNYLASVIDMINNNDLEFINGEETEYNGCGPNCKRCEEDASDYDEELYNALNSMDEEYEEEPEEDESPEEEDRPFGHEYNNTWFNESYRKIVDDFTQNPPATRTGLRKDFAKPSEDEAKMYGKLRELFNLENKVKKKHRQLYFNTLVELTGLIEKNRK